MSIASTGPAKRRMVGPPPANPGLPSPPSVLPPPPPSAGGASPDFPPSLGRPQVDLPGTRSRRGRAAFARQRAWRRSRGTEFLVDPLNRVRAHDVLQQPDADSPR